jgi:signal transduction histidine kinase
MEPTLASRAAETAPPPTSEPLSLQVFEAAVTVPALGVLVYGLVRWPAGSWPGLLLWMILIAVVDLLPVSTWRGIQMLLDFPLLVAVAMLYRPETACAALFLASWDLREFRRQVGPLRAGFNRSQVALSCLATSATFHALGTVHEAFPRVALAGVIAIAAGYAVNAGLVAVGATLLYRESIPTVFARLRIGRPLEFLVGYLGLGILGIAAAELYLRVGFWAVALVIVPVVLARQAFFRNLALEEARQDLAAAYGAERTRVEELERLDRAKAELAQVMTHDFLHALATLRTYASALHRKWDLMDEAERREVAGWIERESGRLKVLAEQSIGLMFNEPHGPRLSPRTERVSDLIAEAVDAAKGLDGRLRVDLKAGSESLTVRADRSRILQVFRNLLVNAATYSPPGSPVELGVGEVNGAVQFTVRDRGPGISPEHIQQLFRPFSRLREAQSVETAGSGLGLYISRRIVEAHGGSLGVDSEPGVGSTFSFVLPSAQG